MVKYDSKFEKRLAEGMFKRITYHPKRLFYFKPETGHKYQPDFVINNKGMTVYIEVKGRFRTMSEAKKYIYIQDSLMGTEELVFLFAKPGLALPGAQYRKDGTKRSHGEWADANGFRWFTEKSVSKLLKSMIE